MPRRTPPRGPETPTPIDDVLRAHGVVLEDIRSRMEMVVEAVTVTRTELKADLHALDSRLSERISILEDAVRENSRDIRKNSEDICTLREQVAGLRHDFDHREEIGRLTGLEARVAAIETRLARRT
jgi:hypothetical protein